MPRAFATFAALALVACDPASPGACEAAAAIAPTLDIGIGETAFLPVSDGDELDLVRGSQGGLMVLGALEATGIVQGSALFADPDNPMVDFELSDAEGARIGGFSEASRHFARGLDDVFTLVGETVVLDVWDAEELQGGDVTFSARILDACGRELTAERVVTLAG